MLLRGTTLDLKEAIESKDLKRITLCQKRLYQSLLDFDKSKKIFNKESFIQQSYKKIEQESIDSANLILNYSYQHLKKSLFLIK